MRLFGKGDNLSNNLDRPTFQIEAFTLRFKAVFPTLSLGASFRNFSESVTNDSTLRTQFEDGTMLTRARYTKLLKTFSVGYDFITAADKTKLVNLQTAVLIGAESFFWIDPTDETEYAVILTSPMKFTVEARNFSYHNVRLEMAEV